VKQISRLAIYFFLLVSSFSCSNDPDPVSTPDTQQHPAPPTVSTLSYSLISSYPHDINSFTEGLVFYNNQLYESTGATPDLPQTRSLFGILDTATGKISVKAELDRNKYFGEGIVFLNGKVYQLTYTTKIGFIYDATTFKKIGQFALPGKEGWGLTTDGKNIIMSDGTHVLTYLDPKTMQVVKTLPVSEYNYAKDHINELEFINGYIYANVWTTQTIVKIDTATGKIVAKLDLTALAENARSLHPRSLEMNGIAFDSIQDRIFVTGKMWPKIYEIRFQH
jgi:glutaminyl-peptide cyclotransferase